MEAIFSSWFLPCLHQSPRKPSKYSLPRSFVALVVAELEEFIVLWKLCCHGNSGTRNFNCKAQYLFMKIINKNANRNAFIILAVSFVLCFSFFFSQKEFSGARFFKITNLLFSSWSSVFGGFCLLVCLNQLRWHIVFSVFNLDTYGWFGAWWHSYQKL